MRKKFTSEQCKEMAETIAAISQDIGLYAEVEDLWSLWNSFSVRVWWDIGRQLF